MQSPFLPSKRSSTVALSAKTCCLPQLTSKRMDGRRPNSTPLPATFVAPNKKRGWELQRVRRWRRKWDSPVLASLARQAALLVLGFPSSSEASLPPPTTFSFCFEKVPCSGGREKKSTVCSYIRSAERKMLSRIDCRMGKTMSALHLHETGFPFPLALLSKVR